MPLGIFYGQMSNFANVWGFVSTVYRYFYFMKTCISILAAICILCVHAQAQQPLPKRKLADTLGIVAERYAAKTTPEKKEMLNRGIQEIVDKGIIYRAVLQKSKAPDFTLKNAKGKAINLYTEIAKGPVILVWYRGGWCPYCNITLRYLQAYLPEFKKYGALLLALTPESPDKTLSTKEKNKLGFEVLTDKDNEVARSYGIAYTLNDTLKKEYETAVGLSKYNGNDKGELPLAATYVVHPNGKVIYAFLDADYRRRAEPADILRALKSLGYPPRQ